MVKQLPEWIIRNKFPAFYDIESKTVLEQTGKVYQSMREMIDDYNCHMAQIIKICHDYIEMMDDKYDAATLYMKENLNQSIQLLLNEMKELGEIDETILNSFNNLDLRTKKLEKINISYLSDSESLIINI